ncbi:hypothetical protein KR067_004459, partial [Drosophila pandora]
FIKKSDWKGFYLADRNFDKPGRIVLVIGADLYPQILLPGITKKGMLLRQKTIFGLTVSVCTKSRGS